MHACMTPPRALSYSRRELFKPKKVVAFERDENLRIVKFADYMQYDVSELYWIIKFWYSERASELNHGSCSMFEIKLE